MVVTRRRRHATEEDGKLRMHLRQPVAAATAAAATAAAAAARPPCRRCHRCELLAELELQLLHAPTTWKIYSSAVPT